MQELRRAPVTKCICLNIEMYLPILQSVFVFRQEMLLDANYVHVEENARYVAPVTKCICLNIEMYLPRFQNVFVYRQEM